MQYFFFLLIALLATFSSYSQIRKTQAVIIFTNNDSLSVDIQDEQLHVIQTRIKYRKINSDNIYTGFPEQVKSVKFADGRLFESVRTDSVSCFLLCLIEGYYNLYIKIERKGLKSYYLRHDQNQTIHLIETFSDQVIGRELQRVSNFEYAHQLTFAMGDNVRITMEIIKTKFVENELVAIVKKYNEYRGNKYPESASFKKNSTEISTGILTGGYPFSAQFIVPGLGVSFDFYSNHHYERFTLKSRILFNILDYKKGDSYSMSMQIPIAVSYNYLDNSRLSLDVLGGITSFLIIDSYTSYGERRSSTSYCLLPYLGTGIDYKIKESAIRFEISIFTLSFMLAYIF